MHALARLALAALALAMVCPSEAGDWSDKKCKAVSKKLARKGCTSEPPTVTYLAVKTATACQTAATEAGAVLRLEGVSPVTSLFADRPSRLVQQVSTKDAAMYFDGVFGDDMPNAMVTGLNASGHPQSCTVILSRPEYQADAASLTYAIQQSPEQREACDAASLAGGLGHCSLFVDGMGDFV